MYSFEDNLIFFQCTDLAVNISLRSVGHIPQTCKTRLYFQYYKMFSSLCFFRMAQVCGGLFCPISF